MPPILSSIVLKSVGSVSSALVFLRFPAGHRDMSHSRQTAPSAAGTLKLSSIEQKGATGIMSQPSILVYGRDPRLLETRRWVLEKDGARVWTATRLAQFDLVDSDESLAILILCHSLSTEECGPAIALAESRWPRIKSLTLIAGQDGCEPGLADQVTDATRGPAHLLRAVEKLVAA